MSGRDPIVVEIVRGDIVESVSALDAVVVDDSGSDVFTAGDPERIAYARSSLKPIQAATCIAEGWKPASDEHIAIACASHNAEPAHLAAVRSLLASAGLDESSLRCPPALPLLDTEAARAGTPQRIMRDCSGKHAAFLATCVVRGWPLDTYLDAVHPMQAAVLDRARAFAGEVVAVGVDGCGAATPASPLRAIATAFGRVMVAEPRVLHAMRAHPFLVAGSQRVDTDVMLHAGGDLTLKAGAEGILCFASPAAGVSGVVKCRDGGARTVPPAAVALLGVLDLLDPLDPALAAHAAPPVLGGGERRGALRVRLPAR